MLYMKYDESSCFFLKEREKNVINDKTCTDHNKVPFEEQNKQFKMTKTYMYCSFIPQKAKFWDKFAVDWLIVFINIVEALYSDFQWIISINLKLTVLLKKNYVDEII